MIQAALYNHKDSIQAATHDILSVWAQNSKIDRKHTLYCVEDLKRHKCIN